MYWTTRNRLAVVLSYLFLISNVSAGQIDINGYATLLGTQTDVKDGTYWNEYANNYADFTHQSRVGLQFNTQVMDDLEFSLTLLAEGKESFHIQAHWFYASYAINDSSSFQFGRLKLPFYLVSNYIDIGHAYPWVTPPPEVYSTNIIESVDGLEYVYEVDLSSSTSLLLNTYIGTDKNDYFLPASFIDSSANTGNYKVGDKTKFESQDLFGLNLTIATDSITFKIGHNQALISLDDVKIYKEQMYIDSIGLIVDISNFILYSEYAVRDTSDLLQPNLPDQDSKYITLGYRVAKFLPFITYATIDKGKSKSKYAIAQKSTTLGFRFDINKKMDIKVQATNIKPGYENGDIGRYGLFDQKMVTGNNFNVFAMSVDILF